MASNTYHFITNWSVKGNITDVYNILSDSEALATWWPSVYLDVKEVEKGDANSIGKKVKLYTKGWLPYTIKWNFEVVESVKPITFTIKAYGDFVGRGIWLLEDRGEYCKVQFDWKLEAEKFLLKNFSVILKPIFSANHRWAMRQGEKSLQLELMRRSTDPALLSTKIPMPRRPTFPHNFLNNKILH